jgi:peptidoglycan/xylan/chitin deacetylase (PgdA/CDA1 family)
LVVQPLLQRYETRATMFLTTGYVHSGKEFWWDEVERLLLSGIHVPDTIELHAESRALKLDIGGRSETSLESGTDARAWTVDDNPAPSRRHEAYRQACAFLRPLTPQSRERVLEDFRSSLQTSVVTRPSHRPMTETEVSQLADNPLVEVGAHTEHHPDLSTLTPSEQSAEIGESKRHLERIVNRRVESFSYPYGVTSSYSPATVKIVQDLGFKRACSNFPGRTSRWSSPFELPRFLVRDWDGDEFTDRLGQWSHGRYDD